MSDTALRLADALERDYRDETLAPRMAAAELRRLVDEVEALTKDRDIHIHYYTRLLAEKEALKTDAEAFRAVVWNCLTVAVRPHKVKVFDGDECLVSIPTYQVGDIEAARDAVKTAVEKLNE